MTLVSRNLQFTSATKSSSDREAGSILRYIFPEPGLWPYAYVIPGHTGIEAYLSQEGCSLLKMNMDNYYLIPKVANNVNGNPGD